VQSQQTAATGEMPLDPTPSCRRQAGGPTRDLPAYSPDLNPIEMALSKLVAALRKGTARTVTVLMKMIAKLIKTFTPDQCESYFQHAGYR